jgi:hypothetical protein
MSVRQIGRIIVLFVGLTGAVLALHDIVFPRGIILQDRRSGRVVLRENQLLLARRERILYAGLGYDEKSAVWERGATIAYEPPLKLGAVVAVEDSRGHRCLLRLTELDPEHRTAVFDIVDPTDRIRHRAELNENMAIPLTNDVKIPWSFHTDSEIHLYADKYLEKPVSQLYRIAFLRATDLNIDVAALPAEGFQSVPGVVNRVSSQD